MKTKELINEWNKKIVSARTTYLMATKKYESVKLPIERAQNQILEIFRNTINNLPENKGTCRCNRSQYDYAHFTDYGISMMISADHPNDIMESNWTWEEVEQVLSKTLIQEHLLENTF